MTLRLYGHLFEGAQGQLSEKIDALREPTMPSRLPWCPSPARDREPVAGAERLHVQPDLTVREGGSPIIHTVRDGTSGMLLCQRGSRHPPTAPPASGPRPLRHFPGTAMMLAMTEPEPGLEDELMEAWQEIGIGLREGAQSRAILAALRSSLRDKGILTESDIAQIVTRAAKVSDDEIGRIWGLGKGGG